MSRRTGFIRMLKAATRRCAFSMKGIGSPVFSSNSLPMASRYNSLSRLESAWNSRPRVSRVIPEVYSL